MKNEEALAAVALVADEVITATAPAISEEVTEHLQVAVVAHNAEPLDEVGEPVVAEATPVAPAAPVELVKKEELTITIKGGSAFTPSQVVFLGVGDMQAKYARWLRNAYAEALALINRENVTANRKTTRSIALMQTLCGMAIAEDEVEHLTYRYEGMAFPKRLDICPPIRAFVIENKDVLQAMASYYGLKRPMFATPKPELPPTMEAVEEVPVNEVPA